jgi:hypothetical protein
MAEFAKIFRTKSYHEAGDWRHAGPDVELMEMISVAVTTMPADQTARFREQCEKYQTYANLPDHLKAQLPTPKDMESAEGEDAEETAADGP